MADAAYAELRLSFTQAENGGTHYNVVAVLDNGEATHSTFAIPLSSAELDAAIRSLSSTRKMKGKAPAEVAVVEPEADTPVAFGRELAKQLFSGNIEALFRQAESAGNVRIRLDMTAEPELNGIPWEFLYRSSIYLAGDDESTVVRELEVDPDARIRPRLDDDVIRMLFVGGWPGEKADKLDISAEQAAIRRVKDKVSSTVELETLFHCTWEELHSRLQKQDYHILHFVGHGSFNDDGKSVVQLQPEGAAGEVDATEFANLIGGHRSLRLVVLNSCEGAKTAVDNPFKSIASVLMRLGTNAVIANQFEITDRAGIDFASHFYQWLLANRDDNGDIKGDPVDVAVAKARLAMLNAHPIEFATPVLFLRPGADARLFGAPATELSLDPPADPAVTAPVGPSPGPSPKNPAAPEQIQPLATGSSTHAVEPNIGRRLIAGVGALVVVVLAIVLALNIVGSDPAEVLEPPPTTVAETTPVPPTPTVAPTPVGSRQGELTTTGVRLRTEPSLAADAITTYNGPPRSARLQVLGPVEQGWYEVLLNEDQGWLFGAFVAPPDRGLAVAQSADLRPVQLLQRDGTSLNRDNPSGNLVLVTGADGGLLRLLVPNGDTAWADRVSLNLISCGAGVNHCAINSAGLDDVLHCGDAARPEYATYDVSSVRPDDPDGGLIVHTEPGITTPESGVLLWDATDIVVTQSCAGTSTRSIWWEIEFEGDLGWVSSNFLSPAVSACLWDQVPQADSYAVTGVPLDDPDGGLVMRSGPGTNTPSLGVLPPDQTGVVPTGGCAALTATSVWWQINFDGDVGWVSSNFLGE